MGVANKTQRKLLITAVDIEGHRSEKPDVIWWMPVMLSPSCFGAKSREWFKVPTRRPF
jgi:hypothetical protein